MMPRIVSGGGINSNKVVQSRSGQKVEPISHRGNVAGVAQQGLATQFRKEPLEQGRGYEPKAVGDTGVTRHLQLRSGGPGAEGLCIGIRFTRDLRPRSSRRGQPCP